MRRFMKIILMMLIAGLQFMLLILKLLFILTKMIY